MANLTKEQIEKKYAKYYEQYEKILDAEAKLRGAMESLQALWNELHEEENKESKDGKTKQTRSVQGSDKEPSGKEERVGK